MSRCIHANGKLDEFMFATHSREVIAGAMEPEGLNEIGNIEFYRFHCSDCGRSWKYNAIPRQAWLLRIHLQLSPPHERLPTEKGAAEGGPE